jgi:hypothetical protein
LRGSNVGVAETPQGSRGSTTRRSGEKRGRMLKDECGMLKMQREFLHSAFRIHPSAFASRSGGSLSRGYRAPRPLAAMRRTITGFPRSHWRDS